MVLLKERLKGIAEYLKGLKKGDFPLVRMEKSGDRYRTIVSSGPTVVRHGRSDITVEKAYNVPRTVVCEVYKRHTDKDAPIEFRDSDDAAILYSTLGEEKVELQSASVDGEFPDYTQAFRDGNQTIETEFEHGRIPITFSVQNLLRVLKYLLCNKDYSETITFFVDPHGIERGSIYFTNGESSNTNYSIDGLVRHEDHPEAVTRGIST